MNCGNETCHILYLLENEPCNDDDYAILKRFRAHLHWKVWQQPANIFSLMLLMSHTWILAYNKYCTDPREQPPDLKFQRELHIIHIQYSLLRNIASLISGGAHQILWTVNVNALYVKGVDILLHRRTSLITPSISPQQRKRPTKLCQQNNEVPQVVSFPLQQSRFKHLRSTSLMFSSNGSWSLWQVSENKYDDG